MEEKEHLHTHHHQAGDQVKTEQGTMTLAVIATLHCLLGCGIGEVAGMIISTWMHLDNLRSIALSVVLGFIAGMALGVLPFLRRKFTLNQAIRIVIAGEGISIAVMELFEVLTQVAIPGVMEAHLHEPVFWIGMVTSLAVGFLAALPVNVVMVRRGIRHIH